MLPFEKIWLGKHDWGALLSKIMEKPIGLNLRE